MLEARITNRKIEIDLVPALRSSHSWERGRQLTVTQCRDSSAKVPAKGETWSTDEEAVRPSWGEVGEGTEADNKLSRQRQQTLSKCTGV